MTTGTDNNEVPGNKAETEVSPATKARLEHAEKATKALADGIKNLAPATDEPKEVKPAEPEGKQEQSEEAKPKLSRRQLEAAKFYGLDPDSTPQETLARIASDRTRFSRMASEYGKLNELVKKIETASPAPGQSAQAEEELSFNLSDLDGSPEALVSKLNKLVQTKVGQQQEAPVTSEESVVQEMPDLDDPEALAEEADDYFASLPSQFKSTYGNEPMEKLEENAPQAAARNEIVQAAFDRMKRARQNNREISFMSALDAEVRANHPDEWLQQQEKKRVTRQQRVGGTMPPSTRASSKDPLSMREKVLSDLSKGIAELRNEDS